MLLDPGHLISFGFGTGLSPYAPGTMGTLVGILSFLGLIYFPIQSPISYFLFCAFFFVVGVYLSERTSDYLESHDHGSIVVDEIVGYLIAASWIPLLALFRPLANAEINFIFVPLTFILFRFFDIAKPWPIGWVDRKCNGGLGIMLDDVLAGILTSVLSPIILCMVGWI